MPDDIQPPAPPPKRLKTKRRALQVPVTPTIHRKLKALTKTRRFASIGGAVEEAVRLLEHRELKRMRLVEALAKGEYRPQLQTVLLEALMLRLRETAK